MEAVCSQKVTAVSERFDRLRCVGGELEHVTNALENADFRWDALSNEQRVQTRGVAQQYFF